MRINMIKKINILSLLFVFGLSLATFSSFPDRVQAGCWYDGGDGYEYWDENCIVMEPFEVQEPYIPPAFDNWPDAPEPEDPCLWSNCIRSVVILPDLSLQWQPLVVSGETNETTGEIIITTQVLDDWGGGGGGSVPTTVDICIVPGACPAPVIEIPVVVVPQELPTAQFDACPNMDGIQSNVPTGMVKDVNFNCVPATVVSQEGQTCQNRNATNFGGSLPCSFSGPAITITDECPNIDDIQTNVPTGMVKDVNFNCVPATVVPQEGQICQNRNATNFGGSLPCSFSGPAITITDACPNMDGVQTSVPTDRRKNTSTGNCDLVGVVPPVVVPPTDVCPNVSGLQTTVPADRRKNPSTGNCDLIVVLPTTGPTANISVSPPSVAEGGSVSFTASGVKGSSIIVWHRLYVSTNQTAGWSGAGPESSSVSGSLNTTPRNPKIFNGPSSYSVIYEVKDLNGRVGSASASVSVTPAVCVGPECGPVLPPITPPSNVGVPAGSGDVEEEEEETFGGFTLDGDTVTPVRFLVNLGGETETKTLAVNPFGDFTESVIVRVQSNNCPSSAQYSFGGGVFANQSQAQATMIYDGANYRNEISGTIGLTVRIKFSGGFPSACNVIFEATGGDMTDPHILQIVPSVANPVFREI